MSATSPSGSTSWRCSPGRAAVKHRGGGQVHRAQRLVQERRRGALPRRHRERLEAWSWSRSIARPSRTWRARRRSPTSSATWTASSCPAGSEAAGSRGWCRAGEIRARERRSVLRHLPRAAGHGDRVRPQRPRARGGEQHGVRSRTGRIRLSRCSRSRSTCATTAGRCASARAIRTCSPAASSARSTASRSFRNATATGTRSPTGTARCSKRRGCSYRRHARSLARRIGAVGRPSLGRRRAVPSGVQVQAHEAHPLFADFVRQSIANSESRGSRASRSKPGHEYEAIRVPAVAPRVRTTRGGLCCSPSSRACSLEYEDSTRRPRSQKTRPTRSSLEMHAHRRPGRGAPLHRRGGPRRDVRRSQAGCSTSRNRVPRARQRR